MNIQHNARSQATKEKIRSALMYLLKHKSFSEIYVKDICKIACINRSSFYEHYQDINDLMIQTENKLSENISKIFSESPRCTNEDFVALFEFIKENKEFYTAYLNNNDRSLMMQNDFIEHKKKINPATVKLNWTQAETVYHMAFFAAGLTAVCKVWLIEGLKETPEQMAQIIFREYSEKLKFFDNREEQKNV